MEIASPKQYPVWETIQGEDKKLRVFRTLSAAIYERHAQCCTFAQPHIREKCPLEIIF